MAIPDFQSVMLPLMELLKDGKEHTMRDLAAILADQFNLTDEDRQTLLPSGQQLVFNNRVAWAKAHLKMAGLIASPSRGNVCIAAAGRAILEQKPSMINCRFLRQFPAYLKSTGRTSDDIGDEKEEESIESRKTPLELLDSSFDTLREATAEELLDRLKNCSPGFFEVIVVRLLMKMGYGGTAGDGSVTGKTGDGGIDGIIKEDKLGLGTIVMQAKRWEGSVSADKVRDFSGGMDTHGATKGVFLTTSYFTKDAIQYAKTNTSKKIILIDGQKLAGLMIEYKVGVTTTKVYELKEVSNDFFDDDEG